MYPEKEGAFNGEVSPTMLLDLGCKFVILGHSERRHKLGESDAFINQEVKVALAIGLDVILCAGETLDQRKAGQMEALFDRQLGLGLATVQSDTLGRVSIAYEPVWAIGNARHHATPQQAREAHAVLRTRSGQIFRKAAAHAAFIQYGGSVVPDASLRHCHELMLGEAGSALVRPRLFFYCFGLVQLVVFFFFGDIIIQ
jgi:triosephosphate isomerase